MGYNLRKNEVYWGYNPLTNLLLTSWDIQVNPLIRPYFQERVWHSGGRPWILHDINFFLPLSLGGQAKAYALVDEQVFALQALHKLSPKQRLPKTILGCPRKLVKG